MTAVLAPVAPATALDPKVLATMESLRDTLWMLNALDTEDAVDNTYTARTTGVPMTAYAATQHALVTLLVKYLGEDRGREVREQVADNGESVAYNINWTAEQAAWVEANPEPTVIDLPIVIGEPLADRSERAYETAKATAAAAWPGEDVDVRPAEIAGGWFDEHGARSLFEVCAHRVGRMGMVTVSYPDAEYTD